MPSLSILEWILFIYKLHAILCSEMTFDKESTGGFVDSWKTSERNAIILIDLLQTKFGARCRAWNVAQFNQEAPPSIRLRLDDELNVPASITNDFIIKDKKEILRYARW